MAKQGHSFESAARALYLIAIGGLIWALDIRLNLQGSGGAWSFDLLHDAAGMALIATGLVSVTLLDERWTFRAVMLSLAVVSLGCLAWSVTVQIRPTAATALPPFAPLLRLTVFLAVAAFCLTMRDTCSRQGLARSAENLLRAFVLFCFALLSPEAVLTTLALLTGQESQQVGRSVAVTALLAAINSAPFVSLLWCGVHLERETSESKAQ
jgi:hypothetical protein